MRAERNIKKEKPQKEFDELLLEVRRVTRVTTGGRRMSFRATILVGNKKGKIGLGTAKGNDVASAVQKASHEAYKHIVEVPITQNGSVPYPITLKHKSCIVRLLPGAEGTGLKAGSSIRSVLEIAGYSNILSKMIGSNNKLNNALATINALLSYKHAEHFSVLNTTSNEEGVTENKKLVEKSTKLDVDSTKDGEKVDIPKPEKMIKEKTEKTQKTTTASAPKVAQKKKGTTKAPSKEKLE